MEIQPWISTSDLSLLHINLDRHVEVLLSSHLLYLQIDMPLFHVTLSDAVYITMSQCSPFSLHWQLWVFHISLLSFLLNAPQQLKLVFHC